MGLLLLSLISVLVTLISLVIFHTKKNLMARLLSLEVLIYIVILIIYFLRGVFISRAVTFSVLLVFAAAGASVGLALLIARRRLHGNDLVGNFL